MRFSRNNIISLIDYFIENITILKLCLRYTVTNGFAILNQIKIFYLKFSFLKKIRDNREKFSKLRTIFLNNVKPDDYDGEEVLPYANNEMITSKVSYFRFFSQHLNSL